MVITSLENEKIKNLIKLNKKKYRDLTSLYLVEGEHLVNEAYKSGVLEEIFLEENEEVNLDVPITRVSKRIIEAVSSVDTPTNIIGVCKKKNSNQILGSKILLLDELQDPGNLGTIIRSAVAFNIDTVILSENTVDLYNPKVIRATQGMMFHTNIISMNMSKAIEVIKDMNINVYATDVNAGIDARDLKADSKRKYALIMGNEGNGVREEIKAQADKNLYINMNDNVESLNVAIATSILLYELGR